jgi:hypothetical protein
MSIIAMLTDEQVAVRILDPLGVASRAPPRGRPRRPGPARHRAGRRRLRRHRSAQPHRLIFAAPSWRGGRLRFVLADLAQTTVAAEPVDANVRSEDEHGCG